VREQIAIAYWLRHYATNRKAVGSKLNEVNEFFFQFTQSFKPYKALEFSQPLTEMRARKIKIMFLGIRERPVRRADNLTSICEPIV
jgi:hypothetical protein